MHLNPGILYVGFGAINTCHLFAFTPAGSGSVVGEVSFLRRYRYVHQQ